MIFKSDEFIDLNDINLEEYSLDYQLNEEEIALYIYFKEFYKNIKEEDEEDDNNNNDDFSLYYLIKIILKLMQKGIDVTNLFKLLKGKKLFNDQNNSLEDKIDNILGILNAYGKNLSGYEKWYKKALKRFTKLFLEDIKSAIKQAKIDNFGTRQKTKSEVKKRKNNLLKSLKQQSKRLKKEKDKNSETKKQFDKKTALQRKLNEKKLEKSKELDEKIKEKDKVKEIETSKNKNITDNKEFSKEFKTEKSSEKPTFINNTQSSSKNQQNSTDKTAVKGLNFNINFGDIVKKAINSGIKILDNIRKNKFNKMNISVNNNEKFERNNFINNSLFNLKKYQEKSEQYSEQKLQQQQGSNHKMSEKDVENLFDERIKIIQNIINSKIQTNKSISTKYIKLEKNMFEIIETFGQKQEKTELYHR